MWELIGLHKALVPHLGLGQILHRWLAHQVGRFSSAHPVRQLLPAYLDDGHPICGTYLDTLISNCGRSRNIPYAWVRCHATDLLQAKASPVNAKTWGGWEYTSN